MINKEDVAAVLELIRPSHQADGGDVELVDVTEDGTVSVELIEWAQIIFVMERSHKAKLTQAFKPELRGKPVVCLNIPDKYKYMDDILVKLLKKKVTPHLPSLHRSHDH